jgi:hypothetical protein
MDLIRRRHVFYVKGYDPQGAAEYHGIFQREIRRFRKTWSVAAAVGALAIDDDDIAHWSIDTTGPQWQVATRYEFLRLETFVTGNLARPIAVQMFRALRWIVGDLASGTTVRIVRASGRFALHLIYLQTMLLIWIAVAIAGGWLAGSVAARLVALSAAAAIGIAVGVGLFAALRPLADRTLARPVGDAWPYLREFARGWPTGYDRMIEIFARRLVAAARADEADEIVLVGHSAGGAVCPAILARALELDAELGRHGPSVLMMTIGSLMPACALHPKAERLRRAIRRIATEPAVLWIDCQARKDAMNFYDFDPVAGVGVQVGPERPNPLIWKIRFRDMLSEESYRRRRANYFRMHYQFILGNDLRAPYDYFMLTCGPLPVVEWAKRGNELVWTFLQDAGLARDGVARSAQG